VDDAHDPPPLLEQITLWDVPGTDSPA
jgi:hypothetical protein